jgi:hypothetical protein
VKCCAGYEVVCPDGRVRHMPYHNLGDAESTARVASRYAVGELAHDVRAGCRCWPEPSRLELSHPPCDGGPHTVRPIAFTHGEHSERGQG